MAKTIAAILFALLAILTPLAAADPAPSPPPNPLDANFTIGPASDLTLYLGERIQLAVIDKRTQKPVAPAHLAWQLDGRPASQLDPANGSWTASDSATVYRAPMKKPASDKLVLTASIVDPAGTATARGSIVITDQKNWISLDGDTGAGSNGLFEVGIDLNAQHSGGGAGAVRLFHQQNAIRIVGNRTGEADWPVVVELELGSSDDPGTYAWQNRNPEIGAIISLPKLHKLYLSAGPDTSGRRATILEGSTTILKNRPIDPRDQVKGFFAGRVMWITHVRNFPIYHYVDARGHFAVPAVSPPPGSSHLSQ